MGKYDFMQSGLELGIKMVNPETKPEDVLRGTMDVGVKMAESLESIVGAAASAQFGKASKDMGLDLNDGAEMPGMSGGSFAVGHEESGEDLNDTGLDAIMDHFQQGKWNDLSLEEQKQSMTDLASYVAADTGNTNPPEIIFRDDMPDGSYGGYNPESNTMEINVNMLDDSLEAADTIAHEMWHAHQQQCAEDPAHPRAAEYQEGFENYISPEYDYEGYQDQMVEAEAREYAQGFKDKLKGAA